MYLTLPNLNYCLLILYPSRCLLVIYVLLIYLLNLCKFLSFFFRKFPVFSTAGGNEVVVSYLCFLIIAYYKTVLSCLLCWALSTNCILNAAAQVILNRGKYDRGLNVPVPGNTPLDVADVIQFRLCTQVYTQYTQHGCWISGQALQTCLQHRWTPATCNQLAIAN